VGLSFALGGEPDDQDDGAQYGVTLMSHYQPERPVSCSRRTPAAHEIVTLGDAALQPRNDERFSSLSATAACDWWLAGVLCC
jgi:hypothetical protein